MDDAGWAEDVRSIPHPLRSTAKLPLTFVVQDQSPSAQGKKPGYPGLELAPETGTENTGIKSNKECVEELRHAMEFDHQILAFNGPNPKVNGVLPE